jgi:probable rRNA maturation factor
VPARIELDVSYAARRPWVPRRSQLSAWARAALCDGAMRPPTGFVLSVRVVGAARSLSLNARYRDKRGPTNVLSFQGAGKSPDGRHYLGELVICAPVVAREAESQGKTLAAHWAHMMVHGVLHLQGFDHQRGAEARKMSRRETQILDRLGFSNPYA